MRWHGIAAVALAATCAGIGAAPRAAASASALGALIDAAGLEGHFTEWPEANAAARERAEAALDPDARALLLREAGAAFAPARIRASVEAALATQLEPAAIRSLTEGYTASGAAGLLGAESALSADDLRDFPRFASEVSRQEVPAERFALVARLDEGTRFGPDAWRVTHAQGTAIDRGTRALGCEGAAWRAPLPPAIESERARLAEPFRERVHVELLFLARAVDARDLRRAARFLETPPARAFHERVGQALEVALASAAEELRQRLAPEIARRCR